MYLNFNIEKEKEEILINSPALTCELSLFNKDLKYFNIISLISKEKIVQLNLFISILFGKNSAETLYEHNIDHRLLNRSFHSICVYQNNIAVFGGYGSSTTNKMERLNNILLYNYKTNKLDVIDGNSQYPLPRLYSCLHAFKEKYFIIFGGRTNPNTPLKDTWYYDIQMNKWKRMKFENENTISSRWSFSSVLLQQSIYIQGGRNQNEIFCDLWKLKIEEIENDLIGEWIELKPSTRRFRHNCINISLSEILFVGGLLDLNYPLKDKPPLEIYNIETDNYISFDLPEVKLFHVYDVNITRNENVLEIFGINYGCKSFKISLNLPGFTVLSITQCDYFPGVRIINVFNQNSHKIVWKRLYRNWWKYKRLLVKP